MNNASGVITPFSEFSWTQRIVLLIAALFPLLSIAVKSGGSTFYALLLLPALFFAWPERKYLSAPERRWLLTLLLLFILAALSLFYVSELDTGIKKLERYFRLATLGLVYLFLRRMGVEAGRLFLVGVVAAAFTLGMQAWYEIHIEHASIASGLYHKIVFGDMAMLNVAIMIAAMLTVASRPWHHLILVVAIGVALYASLMSVTRGSWLVIPAMLTVLVWLYRSRINGRGWLAIILGLSLIAGVLAVWQPKTITKPVNIGIAEIERYLQNPEKAGSWGARLEMWGNSLKIWKENPLLGTGIGDFSHDSQILVAKGLSENELVAEQYGHAHSVYFDALASLGLVGLLVLIMALFILPWRHFSREWCEAVSPWSRFYSLSGLLTVVAFAVFGLTEGWTSRNPFVNPYIIYIAVFASSLVVFARQQQDHRPQD